MVTGDEKWAFYRGYESEVPSDEILSNLKLIVFPGSVESCYDTSLEWMPILSDFIRKVYDNHKHIKIIGGCYGH